MHICQVKWIVLAHTVQLCLMQLPAKFGGNLLAAFKVMVKKRFGLLTCENSV